MADDRHLSRRTVLWSGVAAAAALAGCSGDDEPEDTPAAGTDTPTATATATATETATATPTATETPTPTATPTPEDPAPSLDEFAYPDGASRDGVDGGSLFDSHESTLIDAGSATVSTEVTRLFPNFEEQFTVEKRLGADGLHRTVDDTTSSGTETLWSPSDEDLAYIRMQTGFDERYRIDNEAPSPNEIVELRRFQLVLGGVAWSEATEVVAVDEDAYAVTYEATGVANETMLLQAFHGESVTEVSATVAVTEDGYVRDLEYDLTVETPNGTRNEAVAATLTAVGETTVEEPDWAETAREEGVQFESTLTDDGTAVHLEMVNGGEAAAGTRVALSDGNGRGEATLGEAVTPGDELYLALDETNSLLLGTDGVPEGSRELDQFFRATLRHEGFQLFLSEGPL